MRERYNRLMKTALLLLCGLSLSCVAQTPPAAATVPITLDHNRTIIDVRFPLPDGSTKRVRAWVDNGNPDLWITEDLAKKLGLSFSGEAKEEMGLKVRLVHPPKELRIGGFSVSTAGVPQAYALVDRESIAPGSSAEINLPASVLRHYDVLVDYPNREFTIGPPGSIPFKGDAAKALVNDQNGLLQVSANVAGENSNLALDVGASFSFLADTVVSQLHKTHPDWPYMVGAVGPANMWGSPQEPGMPLLRVPTLQYGGVTFTGAGFGGLSKDAMDWFAKRAGVSTIGLLGANALLNFQVGLDYAHSTVYCQRLRKTTAPDMDVVGLVLRPEPDERFTIVGVAEWQGKPSVPEVKPGDVLVSIDKVPAAGGTMGQVWSLLGGSPGDVRTLVVERDGKQIKVNATVRGFLAETSPVNK